MKLGCFPALAVAGMSAFAAFSEDAYIESNGNQFLNLKAYKKSNTRIWIDFQVTARYQAGALAHYLFGADAGSWAAFYIDNGANFYFKIGDTAQFFSPAVYDTERHAIDMTFNEENGIHRLVFTTGSTTNYNKTISTACTGDTQTCPLMLFGWGRRARSPGLAQNLTAMKVYGVKIWEGTKLTHDYAPCRIEGKYCLKNRVDGRYVAGVSLSNNVYDSEDLTGGGDIADELGDGYIQSHGHERIDLGIKPDATTRVELDHRLSDPTTFGDERYLFGSRGSGAALTFWGWTQGAKLGFGCMTSGSAWSADKYFTDVTPSDSRRTLIVDAAQGLTLHEISGIETSGRSISALAGEVEAPKNLGLFGVMNPTTSAWYDNNLSVMKFYGMNVYKNGQIVKTFTPYIKNALPGVVDQEGNFIRSTDTLSYTNEQFAVGGDINGDAGMDDVYLETTGNEIIDTEWVPTTGTKVVMDFAQLDPGAYSGGYLFGSQDNWKTGPFFWVGMDQWRLAAATADMKWQWIAQSGLLTQGRHVLTVDLSTSTATLKMGEATVATTTLKAPSALVNSMAIMGLNNAGSLVNGSKIRLYSCQIYDGETLVRNYYPAKVDGMIGLYDRENGGFKAPDQTKGIKLRGKTVDGVGLGFSTVPVASADVYRGESVTLTAEAPFASSYVWRCNGEVVVGAHSGSLTIVGEGPRRTVRYSVSPVYTVNPIVGANDRDVEGEALSSMVSFHRTTGPGQIITIR